MIKSYNGYTATFAYDQEADTYQGKVANLRDTITFEGGTIDELEQVFHEAIDDYLEWCHELKEEPEKPDSVNMWLLIPCGLHAHLTASARLQRISLNEYVCDKLKNHRL